MKIAECCSKFAVNWLPPAVFRALVNVRQKISKRASGTDFDDWWRKSGIRERVPAELAEMVDCFVAGQAQASASRYWLWLNRKNIEQLANDGFDNFQQTVAQNYFTWVGGVDSDYARGLLDDARRDGTAFPLAETVRRHSCFTIDQSVMYNVVTFMLYRYIEKIASADELKLLYAPQVGNPPAVEISGRLISQDVLNAFIEYKSVCEGLGAYVPRRIIEIGAGGGRTAQCYLSQQPGLRYVIADIPPALYVSQTYLQRVFPDKRIFSFRRFTSYEQVRDEIENADIVFLMIDQLEHLPDGFADVFQAIDCLHEMRPEQIEKYFSYAGRLAEYFYFKCWQKTDIPFDEVTLTATDYPVDPSWREVFRRPCKVPSTYFEALYRTNAGGD